MVEILKQDILRPISFARQVIIIFAGNEGLLDDIPVPRILNFETDLIAFMDAHYPGVEHEITEKKQLSDSLKSKLTEAIHKFKQQFNQKQN